MPDGTVERIGAFGACGFIGFDGAAGNCGHAAAVERAGFGRARAPRARSEPRPGAPDKATIATSRAGSGSVTRCSIAGGSSRKVFMKRK